MLCACLCVFVSVHDCVCVFVILCACTASGVPRGGLRSSNPPPEIHKALQNRAKLSPIVKTVKNF